MVQSAKPGMATEIALDPQISVSTAYLLSEMQSKSHDVYIFQLCKDAGLLEV